MKKTNNKGFSLVELIVVIAIMAVLIVVAAPQFLKYVEDSRRAKDVQLASSLHTAYLADIADNNTTVITATTVTKAKIDSGDQVKPSTFATYPTVSGRQAGFDAFYVTYDATAGTCAIYIGDGTTYYDLTDETQAAAYKSLR